MGPLSLLLSLLRCIYHLPLDILVPGTYRSSVITLQSFYKLCDVIPCNSLYSPFHFSSFFFSPHPLKKIFTFGCAGSSLLCTGFLQLQYVGLLAPQHVESSQARDRICVSCMAGRFLTTGSPEKSSLASSPGHFCFCYTEFPQVLVFMIFSQTGKALSPLSC